MTDHRPELSRLLLEGHRLIGEQIVEAMEERGYPGVRAGHSAVLLHIDRRSGSRLTELAGRARMSKQGMMLLVDELEALGHLRRVPDPVDGRAKVVRLTARGRRYAAEARRVVAAVEGRVRRRLGDRRYEALRAALETLVEDEG
ncbi:MAG: winged helix-turn-helix transcriptional regulator [Actinobacteria bacterium]|nr:winged helix-turn-helix transcriptional regulator [Actinomycetota bacterium]